MQLPNQRLGAEFLNFSPGRDSNPQKLKKRTNWSRKYLPGRTKIRRWRWKR